MGKRGAMVGFMFLGLENYFKPPRRKGSGEKWKKLFVWRVMWNMATSALSITPLRYCKDWWQNWSNRRWQPWPRCRHFHWELTSSNFVSRGILQKGAGAVIVRRAGLCLFCSMLYSHHSRIAGTQMFMGKCQVVVIHVFETTVDDTRCTSGNRDFARS